jgi:ATP:ADP antiporter, AAA family
MSLKLLFLVAIWSSTLGSATAIANRKQSPVSLTKSTNGVATERLKGHSKMRLIDTVAVLPSAVPDTAAAPWYFSVFPIYPKELAKFFSLSFMMFWIVFVFTMTRDTKDALIVTNCGAEAIAFLKVYGVVPAAALFMITYAKLANNLSPRTLFYVTLAPFFIFYALFAFVLYPLRDILHPLSIKVPEGGLSFAVNLFRHWTFSLYYIITELWGSAGIPLLFWSCANDVVQIDQVGSSLPCLTFITSAFYRHQSCRPSHYLFLLSLKAKRLYPLIALIGNLGPILSGVAMTVVSNAVSKTNSNDEVAFEVSLKILTGMMCGAGALVTGLHWYIHKLTDGEKEERIRVQLLTPQGRATRLAKEAKKKLDKIAEHKKPKLSFIESLRVLGSDKYLRNIATMVLAYGLTMEFTEIIWKSSVKSLFPVKSDYLNFNGRYSTMIGICSFLMMFVGAKVVDVLGWRAGAMMTPVMMAVLALPFFASIIIGGTKSPETLKIAVYVGLVQNVLSKATKYAIFDPTKVNLIYFSVCNLCTLAASPLRPFTVLCTVPAS